MTDDTNAEIPDIDDLADVEGYDIDPAILDALPDDPLLTEDVCLSYIEERDRRLDAACMEVLGRLPTEHDELNCMYDDAGNEAYTVNGKVIICLTPPRAVYDSDNNALAISQRVLRGGGGGTGDE